MASFNKVLLMGNLTRDPQLRFTPSNMAVTDFGLACNRKFKTAQGEDREEVTFVDCTAWGKQAEVINQYCQKGKPIFIEGRLKLDSWEDKQGGGKRSKLSVVVENFQFIGGRDGGGGAATGGPEGDQTQRSAPPQRRSAPPAANNNNNNAPDSSPPIGPDEHFKEDDIPF